MTHTTPAIIDTPKPRHFSAAHRGKLAVAQTGSSKSEETKARISLRNIGRQMTTCNSCHKRQWAFLGDVNCKHCGAPYTDLKPLTPAQQEFVDKVQGGKSATELQAEMREEIKQIVDVTREEEMKKRVATRKLKQKEGREETERGRLNRRIENLKWQQAAIEKELAFYAAGGTRLGYADLCAKENYG